MMELDHGIAGHRQENRAADRVRIPVDHDQVNQLWSSMDDDQVKGGVR